MTARLDIFLVETGGVRWVEAATTLERAKARVQEIAVRAPGEYLVLDHQTGSKLVMKLDSADQGPSR